MFKARLFKIIPRICGLLILCIFTSAHAETLATGSILIAKLNSSINSSQPDKLITATIVDGKYKGAALQGKFTASSDKLVFTKIHLNKSPAESINAYAIDPSTARTALKAKVAANYLQSNADILAKSFIQGYSTKNTTNIELHKNALIGVLFVNS